MRILPVVLAIGPIILTIVLGIWLSIERIKSNRRRVNNVLEWVESQKPKEEITNG